VPVMLINGRMSDSSYRGYKLLRGLFRRITEMMSLLCVQGESDAERLRALDVPEDRICVVGSSKYDMADISGGHREYVHALLQTAGMKEGASVIVAGSTWAGEEAILLRLFKRIRESHPETFLVLVPRHVERARQVMAVLKKSGVPWVLRSMLKPPQVFEDAPVAVLLVDTTGELKDFYVHADVIFVGKSLSQHGGQNIIEPAALGKPVVVGPNMENFVPVMADFTAANAVVQVADEIGLYESLIELLADDSMREELGRLGRKVVMERRGAVQKTVDLFARLLDSNERPSTGDVSA
jgi:3-deoxy-D-manno-octulosonic-acid transferase